jgi:hypothetical protein
VASHKSKEWYLERARATEQKEGEVEFDDDAKVSMNETLDTDHGAYVQGWVWVPDPEEYEDHECDEACEKKAEVAVNV